MIVCLGLAALSACQAGGPNLCVNPGFELLDPAGDNFPLNWYRQITAEEDSAVRITNEAHSGSVAVVLQAGSKGSAVLNSDPIAVRRGEVTFWYLAKQSDTSGANLAFYVIGLNSAGIETRRVGVCVPAEHVADGQWHQARIEFDFVQDPSVAQVLLAPRVNENTPVETGVWIIDDISCLAEKAGPKPEIGAFYTTTPILTVSEEAEVGAHIFNAGDESAVGLALRLILPPGISLAPGSNSVENRRDQLEPGESWRVSWQVAASAPVNAELLLEMSFGANKLTAARKILFVATRNPRYECTAGDTSWRTMPELTTLQEGNESPLEDIRPSKSTDLPDSYFGITAHLPRSRDLEVVFEPEHLIDGDPETTWSGRAHATSIPGPADWVEIELARPTAVREIRLIPYHKGEGFPLDFAILVAGEEKTWLPAAQRTGQTAPPHTPGEPKTPFVIRLDESIRTRAIRLEATRFTGAHPFFTDCAGTYYLRLSGIEVINERGQNVALSQEGARVQVSTTFRSFFNSREVIAKTYPELYEIGVKWNRVGQWGDWSCWSAVEREKGVYYIDPEMDRGITDSINNGVQILYTLDYGNRLYEETPWLANPGPVWKQGHPFMGDGGPTTDEAIQGFVNYARFVAKHFRGRVNYYEIWNEENSWAWYGSPPDPSAFGKLVRETAKAIKEIAPEAKVMVGGTAALAPVFLTQALEEGAGPYLDAIAFHPYTMPYPEMGLGSLDVIDGKQQGKPADQLGFRTYAEMLEFLKKTFHRFNPNLEFWADEWNAIPKREDSPYNGLSELQEAKHGARFFLYNQVMGVHAVWWSLCNENYVYDWAVLRTGDHSRKPVFYAMQAVCTFMSGATLEPAVEATWTGDAPEVQAPVFRGRDGDILIPIWSAVNPVEDYQAVPVELRVTGAIPAKPKCDAVDVLYGKTQPLQVRLGDGSLSIPGLLVTDYPVIVRIKARR